jgi:hypothetical protein
LSPTQHFNPVCHVISSVRWDSLHDFPANAVNAVLYTKLFGQAAHLKPVRCRVLCRLGTDCVVILIQIPPEMFTECYLYLPSITIDILLFLRVYTQMKMPLFIKTSNM